MPKTGTSIVVRTNPNTKDCTPEFCAQVLQMGDLGMFPAEWAAHFGVSVATIRKWKERYPAFREVSEIAMAKVQAKMERLAFDSLGRSKFQATTWARMMAAHFPDDYTERRETKNTIIDNSAAATDVRQLTDEQLTERLQNAFEARRSRQAAMDKLAEQRRRQKDANAAGGETDGSS